MYYILKFLAFLLAQLPTRIIIAFAHILTFLAFDCLRFRRKLVLQNINIAFKDSLSAIQKQQIARKSYFHFCLTIFEIFRSFKYPLDAKVTFENEHYLQNAISAGRGAFILCGHMGNWEAMGASVSNKLVKTHVFVKKVGSDSVNRFVEEMRSRNGFLYIQRKKGGDGVRALVRALKRNEAIGFVMDQAKADGPKIPFFGKQAKTNPSLAWLWQNYPVPIIPAYAHRRQLDQHTVTFLPPLELVDKQNEDQSDALMKAFNQTLEQIILKHPEQYFWFHDRWKF